MEGEEKRDKKRKKEKKDKKKKKEKKEKKNKKEKKQKNEREGDNNDDEVWEEVSSVNLTSKNNEKEGKEMDLKEKNEDLREEKNKREEWMLAPPKRDGIATDFMGNILKSRSKDEAVQKEEQKPSEENSNVSSLLESSKGKEETKVEEKKTFLVGDGGASWRAKAAKRAQEMAQQEGKEVSSILKEKWEDRNVSHSNDQRQSHNNNRRGDNKEAYRRTDSNTRDYLKDERHQMRSSSHSDSNLSSKVEEKTNFASVIPKIGTSSLESEEKLPDKNLLASQILKAKLTGNSELEKRLRGEMEDLERKLKMREVKVSGLDENGRPILQNIQSNNQISGRNKKNDEIVNGQRERYFADDDMSLDALVAREKLGKDNYDNNYAKSIMNQSNFKLTGTDSQYDDMSLNQWESSSSKKLGDKQQEIQKRKAIQAHNRQEKIHSNCWFCFHNNPKLDRSLLVAMGNFVYLALPKRGTLVPGHCLIIPMEHTISISTVEDQVWDEIALFMKYLGRMFKQIKREPVFIEVATEFKKQRHTFIECIPLPFADADQAPIYFKKALMESESEWSQHKKMINTTGKTIRRSVPPNFPYFSVEFGENGGYAHIIEDEIKFSRTLGREVIAGMLDLDSDIWMRPQNDTPEESRQKMKTFLQHWEPHDFTQHLE
eukprot:TRINITY_DN8777_c0_g1_i1.p1 TRINITY_DN8777_c0_g1~~TRINITY_DN8777_c0_g1_i1.p1  ORF type:complete len:658 (-),score=305.69 TRINITY_DN8777_c0_g1_i1:138-2111(-)